MSASPSAAPVADVPPSALAMAFSFAIKRILRERVSRMPPGLIWMDGRRSTGLMPSVYVRERKLVKFKFHFGDWFGKFLSCWRNLLSRGPTRAAALKGSAPQPH